MTMILLAAAITASISFLCSLMEAALYSVPTSRIKTLIQQDVPGATLLLRLREKVDEPISAILTFNTIANTVGGIVVGALVAAEYGAGSPMVAVFAALFTMLILFFSEILPKTLGVTYADLIAPRVAVIIQLLIVVLYPMVRMSNYVTARIRSAGEEKATVSEQDIVEMARIGVEEGSLIPEEAVWIRNALRLNEKTAHELMTPRTVVYRLPSELPLTMVTAHSEHWTHSRLPLCKDNDPDRVVGIVYRREVFDALLNKSDEEIESMKLSELAHPAEFIPETMKGNEILRRFLEGRTHLFIVANEHGGMEGVITLEDVLEDLLGAEIVDHHDLHVDMQEYARALARKRRPPVASSEATRVTPPDFTD
jgi:CBS domain containing-hemolysin-like protein